MNKLYLYIPYVIFFDIMAFLFFKHYDPNKITTLLIPIIGILMIYSYFRLHKNLEKVIIYKVNNFFSQEKFDFINSYTIPSIIIYRVKKHCDCTSEEVAIAQNELKTLFKHHLSDLISNTTKGSHMFLKSNLAYEIWKELSLSDSIYKDFCKKAFGHYYPFNNSNTYESIPLQKELFPHLSNTQILN